MVSSPKPPDPYQTAQAQAGMNRDTALTTQATNMTNQVTPYGNLTYNQTGNSSFVDSNGKTVTTPTYTATTTLSPEQQQILDQSNQASLGLGKLANQQIGSITDQLSKPFDYTTSDAEDYAYNLGSKRLDPRFAQESDDLRSQLIASGIRPGTAAYAQQMNTFNQGKNDAYDQLALGAQQQGYQQALTTYNNPINTISALTSGSQVTNPTFVNTPQTSVGGVDYSGLVNTNYNQQAAQSSATAGGLFGLLGTGLTAGIKFSDRRMKENIRRVGRLDNGLPVYSYNLIGSTVPELGLMADEVEAMHPDAVHAQPNGFKMVDYHRATEAA